MTSGIPAIGIGIALVLSVGLTNAVAPEQDLDADIQLVATGGLWRHNDRHGSCRVVVRARGWEHVRSEVTIQWLTADASTQSVAILHSETVGELSEDNWTNVQALRFLPDGPDNAFEVQYTQRPSDEVVLQSILVCKEPGHYAVEP